MTVTTAGLLTAGQTILLPAPAPSLQEQTKEIQQATEAGGWMHLIFTDGTGWTPRVGREITLVETPSLLLFTGDWEHNSTLDAYEVAFEAVRFGTSWNGFATPVVTHKVMDALVARQGWLSALSPNTYDQWIWDGNGVMVTALDSDDPADVLWLLPDSEGLFDLAPMGLTFETPDPEANILHTIRSL